MPFGITWVQYLKLYAAGIAGIISGAQLVHVYYQPLKNLPQLIDEEVEILRTSNAVIVETLDEKIARYHEMEQKFQEFENKYK